MTQPTKRTAAEWALRAMVDVILPLGPGFAARAEAADKLMPMFQQAMDEASKPLKSELDQIKSANIDGKVWIPAEKHEAARDDGLVRFQGLPITSAHKTHFASSNPDNAPLLNTECKAPERKQ